MEVLCVPAQVIKGTTSTVCRKAGFKFLQYTRNTGFRCLPERCNARGINKSLVCSASGQEVEIKLRLSDEEAHKRLASALSSRLRATHLQENYFFDGAKKELSAQRTVVRCRFYNIDKRALLTIKGQQVLQGGIGRGTEVEEDIDPKLARSFIEKPENLLHLRSEMLQNVLRKNDVQELVCLGGFTNHRNDYDWEGFKLELDKTIYPWGTVFEVEVETDKPEVLKEKLESFLQTVEVNYKDSTTTKFANFINQTLL